jgi:hypothetical protein
MEKEEARFFIEHCWMNNWDSKQVHQELVTTLRADAYARSQIKIWLQKFRNGDLFTSPLSARSCLDKKLLDMFFPLANISLERHFNAVEKVLLLQSGIFSQKRKTDGSICREKNAIDRK